MPKRNKPPATLRPKKVKKVHILDSPIHHSSFLFPDSTQKESLDTTLPQFTFDDLPATTPPTSPPSMLVKDDYVSNLSSPNTSINSDKDWESFLNSFQHPLKKSESIPVYDVTKDPTLDQLWVQDPHLTSVESFSDITASLFPEELEAYEEGILNDVLRSEKEKPISSRAHLLKESSSSEQSSSKDKFFDNSNDSDEQQLVDWESLEPAIPELLQDDLEEGLKRKEHFKEFQDTSGLDFGDEREGFFDDDE
jgi:hypothetical protein